MKKINFAILCGLLAINCQLIAQGSSSPGGGSSSTKIKGTTPSTIVRPPLVKPRVPEKEIELQNDRGVVQRYTIRPIFTQPGILSLRAEGFVGVDHLFNVGSNIPVDVELVKSDSVMISITSEKIQAMVEKIFNSEGINPSVKPSTGPALPFFHILVMIIPSGDGHSAFCAGRLFEKVNLDRVTLPVEVYFQAITWEYQNLIYASKEDSEKQIESAIADIIQQFLSRYKYYKNISAP